MALCLSKLSTILNFVQCRIPDDDDSDHNIDKAPHLGELFYK